VTSLNHNSSFRHTKGDFKEEYMPTIFHEERVPFNEHGHRGTLVLKDTAG
jgi:hypothetical protein